MLPQLQSWLLNGVCSMLVIASIPLRLGNGTHGLKIEANLDSIVRDGPGNIFWASRNSCFSSLKSPNERVRERRAIRSSECVEEADFCYCDAVG